MSLFLPLQTKILFYGDPASPPIPKGDCTRTLKELCWQDLCKRSLGKISEQDLQKRSLGKISAQAPYISWQDICARFLDLCEHAQSKCTWTCHKSHLTREFTGKMPNPRTATPVFCEPAQLKCTWTCHRSHFEWKFTGKMPNAYPGAIVLREPAQSKYTWTVHKSNFVWKFTKKMPDATDTTSIEHRAVTLNYRKNPSVWPC